MLSSFNQRTEFNRKYGATTRNQDKELIGGSMFGNHAGGMTLNGILEKNGLMKTQSAFDLHGNKNDL